MKAPSVYENLMSQLSQNIDIQSGRKHSLLFQIKAMEEVAFQSKLVATDEQLMDYFCIQASKRLDASTAERLLDDLAETKIRIPAIFEEISHNKPDLEYLDYEVLPEVESLINQTFKVLKQKN